MVQPQDPVMSDQSSRKGQSLDHYCLFIGPLLFLVLIGDIYSNVASSFVSSFADDTRIGRHIKTKSDVKKRSSDSFECYIPMDC